MASFEIPLVPLLASSAPLLVHHAAISTADSDFGALSAIARATFGLNHTPIAKLTHAVAHFTVTQYGLWRFGQGLC